MKTKLNPNFHGLNLSGFHSIETKNTHKSNNKIAIQKIELQVKNGNQKQIAPITLPIQTTSLRSTRGGGSSTAKQQKG